jgi:hypothetical protein
MRKPVAYAQACHERCFVIHQLKASGTFVFVRLFVCGSKAQQSTQHKT